MHKRFSDHIRRRLWRPATYALAVLPMVAFVGCGAEDPIPSAAISEAPASDEPSLFPSPTPSEEPSPTPSVDQYRIDACQAIKEVSPARMITVEGANSVAQLGVMASDSAVSNASTALLAAAEGIANDGLEEDWYTIYRTLLEACQVVAPGPIPRVAVQCSDEEMAPHVYPSLQRAWADKNSKKYCHGVFLGPRPYAPTKAEKSAAKRWDGSTDETLENRVEGAIGFCADFVPSEERRAPGPRERSSMMGSTRSA